MYSEMFFDALSQKNTEIFDLVWKDRHSSEARQLWENIYRTLSLDTVPTRAVPNVADFYSLGCNIFSVDSDFKFSIHLAQKMIAWDLFDQIPGEIQKIFYVDLIFYYLDLEADKELVNTTARIINDSRLKEKLWTIRFAVQKLQEYFCIHVEDSSEEVLPQVEIPEDISDELVALIDALRANDLLKKRYRSPLGAYRSYDDLCAALRAFKLAK